jgi:hypothetical protein
MDRRSIVKRPSRQSLGVAYLGGAALVWTWLELRWLRRRASWRIDHAVPWQVRRQLDLAPGSRASRHARR